MMQILGTIFFLLVLWASGAEAACIGSGMNWSCTAGSSAADVQAAVSNASDGATISFAAGPYIWAGSITLSQSKGVTLICDSIEACTVTLNCWSCILLRGTLSDIDKLYRVSGFSFSGVNAGGYAINFDTYGSSASRTIFRQIRIDHNKFQNLNGAGWILFGEVSKPYAEYGVIDHNKFIDSQTTLAIFTIGNQWTAPAETTYRGTSNNLFVEDNLFTYTALSAGTICIDGWGGDSIVFRYNTVLNCLVTTHGVIHAGGPWNFELYENLIQVDFNAGIFRDCYRCFHHLGSGEFIAFNNRFTSNSGKNPSALSVAHYRAVPQDPPYGQCAGTNSTLPDGNRSPVSTYYGYPCWRQPGRDGNAILSPMYAWNNYWTDTLAQVPLSFETQSGYGSYHVQNNRDFYNAVSTLAQTSPTTPFNGSSGMGFGRLANRPLTCATTPSSADAGRGGVGYFAMDDGIHGTLYRCTATNMWTVHYTPYAYPHPLQTNAGGGGQDFMPPPANVQVR